MVYGRRTRSCHYLFKSPHTNSSRKTPSLSKSVPRSASKRTSMVTTYSEMSKTRSCKTSTALKAPESGQTRKQPLSMSQPQLSQQLIISASSPPSAGNASTLPKPSMAPSSPKSSASRAPQNKTPSSRICALPSTPPALQPTYKE